MPVRSLLLPVLVFRLAGGSRLAGILLAQALLVPSALLIVFVAQRL